jgi:thiol-disulfide isomerase/thioredoxin
MTASLVPFGARTKWIGLAATTLATLMMGCSGSDGSSTTGAGGSPAKTERTATTSPPVAPQEVTSGTQGNSGSVTVQSVSPEEFKKIIATQKGKVVLVDFWATWCGPCRKKFPQTLALAKKYGPQGLTVVSVSMDSPDPRDQEKVLKFLQEQNAQITNLTNRMEDSEAAFGAFDIDGGALPHYKIFDRKGKPGRKFGGDPDHPFDEKDIERAVVAALKEQ